jgi:pimeloyl-ACP methyl ester carboxylesterase
VNCAFLFRVVILALALISRFATAAVPAGVSAESVDIGGEAIEVQYYKPARYDGGPLLVSFHGLSRNAAGYLDAVRPLADRHGMLVVAPLFDTKRFPYQRYQALGITRVPRKVTTGNIPVEPRENWTSTIIFKLIDHVRGREGQRRLDYYLLGHSAGAQIANRIAAFAPHQARRIVVANPSSYVWPSRDARFPYGLGDLPPDMSSDTALQRYLAQPMTLLLGTADINVTPDLDVLPQAMRQGSMRYERGLNAFRAARTLAQEKGWTFNWRLIEVPNVGHDAKRMYGGAEAAAAFAPN